MNSENARPPLATAPKTARWGWCYGGPVVTRDGRKLDLRRNGQRCRFYDGDVQVGPEQRNVAPALAYAMAHGWRV